MKYRTSQQTDFQCHILCNSFLLRQTTDTLHQTSYFSQQELIADAGSRKAIGAGIARPRSNHQRPALTHWGIGLARSVR